MSIKVLMITPAVDSKDTVFGFIPSWINNIASKVGYVYVVTVRSGEANLNENVEVHAVREKNNKLVKIGYFAYLLFKYIRKSDVVFTHMFPEFPIYAYPIAKLFRKPIVMWRAHGYIDLRSKISHRLVDRVVTSSKDGFAIVSNKVRVIGQGIDTDNFKPIQG